VLNLVQVLTKARGVLAAVAPLTPIKSDDAFLALLDAVLEDAELFGYVHQKVNDEADGKLSLESTPPVAIQGALEQRGIAFKQLLDAIPVIISLWKLFRA
jgi:hypothetical protein